MCSCRSSSKILARPRSNSTADIKTSTRSLHQRSRGSNMDEFPAERTVIVTGAVSPRGIGRATVDYLAERGWNIGVIDLDDAASKRVAQEVIQEHGVKAAGAGANVANEASVRAAIDELEAALPQIVALANVAGVTSPAQGPATLARPTSRSIPSPPAPSTLTSWAAR